MSIYHYPVVNILGSTGPQGPAGTVNPLPGPYANDAAAALGGVAVGSVYRRSDGFVVWRQV